MKKTVLMVAMLMLVAFVAVAMAQQKATPAPAPAPAKPTATAAPAPAPASAKPASTAPAKPQSFSGQITKVDAMAKSVMVKGMVKGKSEEMTFVTDDKTKITKGGKEFPFGDMKEGMQANISYKKEGDKNMAASIKVAAPKAAPKKK